VGKPNRAKQAGWDLAELDSCGGGRYPFKRDLFKTDHSKQTMFITDLFITDLFITDPFITDHVHNRSRS